jgi:hypothetical protein
VTALRNVAIIALLALVVAAVPGGGETADAIVTAISIGFLVGIGFLGLRLYRENRFTLWSMPTRDRAILHGAVGVMALMLAGADKMFDTGGGTVAWLALVGLSLFAVVRVWLEATRYS